MRILIVATLATCTALAGCGTGRLLTYGGQLADAKVLLGAAEFQIYVHPKDRTLLVQRSIGQISGGRDPAYEFRAAAAQFLAPVACEAGSAIQIAPGSFEASYECESGVDLPQIVAQQRAALRAGSPLRRE